MNVHAMSHAKVHIGFRQNNTSSTRSWTQNKGPTYSTCVRKDIHIPHCLIAIRSQSEAGTRPTLVTNRRKLFDNTGRLSVSL
jgi:hypothetical protein